MAVNFFLQTCKSRLLRNCLSKSQHLRSFNPLNLAQCVPFGIGKGTLCKLSYKNISTTAWMCDSDSVSCWKCGVIVDLNKDLFCDYCEVVQKPKGDADYFTIFGMEKSFEIDARELTKNFRLLQMQLHPDRFSQKSEDEKQISAHYSSLLNQAYKTLGSPLERGLYLLEIQGHPLSDEGEIIMKPEFLSEIMEINEEIHEAEDNNDLERIKKTNEIMLGKLFRRAADRFRNNDWVAARECLAQLKYYSKIQDRIKELEQEFEEEKIN
ncbi:iron-sulfur cluster co-chaperone protein HscB-like [Daphnia pulex]|uniref:iron-sulfur cluster co-chaperone protein HscB-like n=1 Tax=Daphnia pulex TaxID=6669 RepID=UPI001EDF35DA|nr:iron-sulfur cluster co-chaperone protein HscB-like [Daphnia pulex]